MSNTCDTAKANEIFDLLYGAEPHKEELRKLFPTAKIEDASDEIHEGRLSISVNMDENEYARRLIENGFASVSFLIVSGGFSFLKD
ncbi:MAG: hypothetical protein PHS95_02075 [Candidatus Pacebacteria bacterium]|nr:hypothetical protein [Candidatus Paceibacterota bacterium]